MRLRFKDSRLVRRECEISGSSSERWRWALNIGTSIGQSAKMSMVLCTLVLFPTLLLAQLFDALEVSQLYFRVPLVAALVLLAGVWIRGLRWSICWWRRGCVLIDDLIDAALFLTAIAVLIWILFTAEWVPTLW